LGYGFIFGHSVFQCHFSFFASPLSSFFSFAVTCMHLRDALYLTQDAFYFVQAARFYKAYIIHTFSGGSKNVEGGRRQFISFVLIYRICAQRKKWVFEKKDQ